jgi:phosphatidylglycerol---prolipoprotein diacylglyceryl transferase
MFVDNINPVLLKIGSLEIRYYGIIYALGFMLTYIFLRYYIRKEKITNLNEKQLDDLMIYIIIGVVVGARFLYFVFYSPFTFFTNPFEVFIIWHGGLSFHGGLIGVILALILFSRKLKVNFMQIADAITIPASLGLALGRIANFTNQELYGTITNVPWCVKFTTSEGCRHPYQLYASLSHFIMFFILFLIYKNQKKEGTTFWSFVFFYGLFRFITDFWREEIIITFGLNEGQLLCLVMIAVSSVLIIKRKLNKKRIKQMFKSNN